MIQRIQTIYLLIVFINSVLLFFFPFCEYFTSSGAYVFDIFGIGVLSNGVPVKLTNAVLLLSINGVIGGLALMAIFLFKKRMLQIKLGRLLLFLLTIFLVLIFYYSDKFTELLPVQASSKSYLTGSYLPILSFIFTFLANKAIRKDEALVRSADRIR